MTPTTRATIDDIARAAGVSKGTVSRVLNGHSTVAARTRQRVQDVMAQLSYAPDPAARHLSWRTGQTLGLSLDRDDPLLHPYHVLFRRALESQTAPQGVQLVDLRADLQGMARLPSAVLVMHAVDGDSRLSYLAAQGVPAVLIGHQPGAFWVAPDDVGGARLATRQLTGAGHRQLAYLGAGPSQVAQDREYGARDAARAAGATLQTIASDFTVLGGYRAVRRAWEGGLRFTGLFAQSDESAAGAVAALDDLGVRVPHEVSVVGFDGLPELPIPLKLTTVAQDIPRIAATALTLVQEAIRGLPARGEFIPVHLMPGATVAPPPGGTP
ncbi:LacI family DNA-binding transcriptional regulator [Deinococcus multiflagellatus]|uniref:LacI family DNA-binding transcriptional regulator n=1 Tax=Deinococcus multiflagellatus TaxID=1656887 RepID=UPI001CCB1B71|nr:LacI family DNA-binding transcriptional regulator [Deinococcus multiflagellatus]MBZ9714080.1 LacI family transcriptional regulator [Deinococcus multiflagellatus]